MLTGALSPVSSCYARRCKTIDPDNTQNPEPRMERRIRNARGRGAAAGVYLLGS